MSLHSVFFILLCLKYVHHFIFQLTYPVFFLSYSALGSLLLSFSFNSVIVLFIAVYLFFIPSYIFIKHFLSSWSVPPFYLSELPFYFWEQLYANKMDNLEEMEKFFRKVQLYKTEPGRNKNYEEANLECWNLNYD